MNVNLYAVFNDNDLKIFHSLDDLPKVKDATALWLDLETQSREVVTQVVHHFNLHELTIEDSLDLDHLPKFEDYDSYLFFIFRALALKPSEHIVDDEAATQRDHSEEEDFTSQISFYLSEKFLITIHGQEIPWLEAVLRQVKQHPDKLIFNGPDAVAHKIIDVGVDRFERGLEVFDRRIDNLEEAAIHNPIDFEMYYILDMKRELVALRQIARAQRAIILRLANETSAIVEDDRMIYFKDIDDQAVSLINMLDKLIDNLQGVRDAYFAFSNERLGDTMRILAVITTILAPLNILVGIYGMNFSVMPLLHNPNGFWIIVGLLLFVTVSMLSYFRRKHWL